ncbi:MAG: stage IV sporulation protein A [Acutalibacteraceae bacterium]
MTSTSIYQDIALRTKGDIYIGVVGPVRTGKSTFIKRFMDTLVLPNMEDENIRQRATDELPQSAAGRTIMTTEPKFIPEEAVEMELDSSSKFRVRLIDCVGYIVPSSLGYIENDQPRMVQTPWFESEIPFNMAAEIGTQKVINEHSTIGLVITTDGSISDIPREEYKEAEERVINELKELNKPFIVLLNCTDPESAESRKLAKELESEYGVCVKPVNCTSITPEEFSDILSQILFEFPTREIKIDIPFWLASLEKEHKIRNTVYKCIGSAALKSERVRDVRSYLKDFGENEYITDVKIKNIDLSSGSVTLTLTPKSELFYDILSEKTGIAIRNERELSQEIIELSKMKEKFRRFEEALSQVESTGYGIVMPTMEELTLDEPEMMKQGGKYGVRLRASAPSIHMMRANITTEVAPIVGSESQSEELVTYLLKEFDDDPSKIWESNIFGKSLHSLVNEGLHNKLYKMPPEARMKLQETLERIINENCSGLICIIL